MRLLWGGERTGTTVGLMVPCVRPAFHTATAWPRLNTKDGLAALAFYYTGGWNQWEEVTVTARLQKGINTVQLLTIGGNGGPRIKRMVLKASCKSLRSHAPLQACSRPASTHTRVKGACQLVLSSGRTHRPTGTVEGHVPYPVDSQRPYGVCTRLRARHSDRPSLRTRALLCAGSPTQSTGRGPTSTEHVAPAKS